MSNFPVSPIQFQIYTEETTGREWQWDGRKWNFLDKAFYQSKGQQGPMGGMGMTGPSGPKGDAGQKGDEGPQGKTGSDGLQGPSGPQGERGQPGIQGDAYCRQVIEAPASGSLRGTLYLNAWNEVFVAIG